MVHAQPGVLQLLKGVAAHIQSKFGYGRIVVQAGGGGGLDVVRVVHVARSVGPVEGELVGIHHHFRHEQTVGGVELGQLSGLQGHVVPVHVETVISRTAEQIRTVRIDPRHHNNVDIVQQSCGLRIGDQIGHYHQSALTSGGLVGMDLRLIPHSGLAVGVDQIGSFLQGGVLGDRRLGEDGQRDVEFVVGGGSGRIQVHVVTLGIHFLHVRYHLVLSGKLMGSVSAVEGGGGVAARFMSGTLNGEVLVQDLVGPDAQHVVPGIHHIGIGSMAGLHGRLIAVAERIFVGAQLAAGDLHGNCTAGQIRFCHVEDLQNVVVAVAVDVVAVSTGLVDVVAAVLIGSDLCQLSIVDHRVQSAAGRGGEAAVQVHLNFFRRDPFGVSEGQSSPVIIDARVLYQSAQQSIALVLVYVCTAGILQSIPLRVPLESQRKQAVLVLNGLHDSVRGHGHDSQTVTQIIRVHRLVVGSGNPLQGICAKNIVQPLGFLADGDSFVASTAS